MPIDGNTPLLCCCCIPQPTSACVAKRDCFLFPASSLNRVARYYGQLDPLIAMLHYLHLYRPSFICRIVRLASESHGPLFPFRATKTGRSISSWSSFSVVAHCHGTRDSSQRNRAMHRSRDSKRYPNLQRCSCGWVRTIASRKLMICGSREHGVYLP